MNMLKYQTEDAPRTLSPSFHAEHAYPEYLLGIYTTSLVINAMADAYKKAIYYNKYPEEGLPLLGHVRASDEIRKASSIVDMQKGNVDLLHAALGMLTESIEFFEEVLKSFTIDDEMDEAHAREELGDLLWYQAIALNELKSTFEAEAERNIAKLKARYPEKFTEEAAVNRDTDAEQLAMNL